MDTSYGVGQQDIEYKLALILVIYFSMTNPLIWLALCRRTTGMEEITSFLYKKQTETFKLSWFQSHSLAA